MFIEKMRSKYKNRYVAFASEPALKVEENIVKKNKYSEVIISFGSENVIFLKHGVTLK